jgi:hypothetical protein
MDRRLRPVIVLFLAFMFLSCERECENPVSANAPVAIVTPCDQSRVGWRTLIGGRVSNPKAVVHVIIHPLEVNEHWVQPKIDVKSDGTWQVLAYFGRDGSVDVGKPFEIAAVVNPKAMLDEADQLADWPDAEARSDIVRVTRD